MNVSKVSYKAIFWIDLYFCLHQVMEETARNILSQCPEVFDEEAVSKKYPVMYEQSMNTVLIQEAIRYGARYDLCMDEYIMTDIILI